MLDLNQETGPLYTRIYRQLKSQIESGALPAGTRVPSRRALSEQLGVSRNTVEAAYAQLESEGYLEARPRQGFIVLPIESLNFTPAAPSPPPPDTPRDTGPLVDFAPGRVAEDRFPSSVWRRLLRSCWNDAPDLLRRSPPMGNFALRQAIADYLRQARGVRAEPEQILLGAGTEPLLLRLSFLLDGDSTLAVENPVYHRAYEFFSRMGHPVLPVEVDGSGVRIQPLEGLDNAVLYTTPSHQYPLGSSMPMGRRTQALNWAAAGRFRYILEDDYDSEFRYGTRPLPSLQSIDRNDRVIYLGSFSGSLAPSVRIGYLVLPPVLLTLYERRCGGFSSDVSALEQAVLLEFLRSGRYETHLNRMRVCYKNRRKRLLDGLAPLSCRFEPVGEAAGCNLTLRFPGQTERALCETARSAGVRVYPISSYFIGPMPARYEGEVLLGFGGLNEAQIDRGTSLLCGVW